MKKYIVVYHAPEAWSKQMKGVKPEDTKKEMEAWMAWAKRCGSGLIDLGAPLGGGLKISKTGSTPSKRDVVGYSILQAESMEKAKSMLKDHPHLKMGIGCEIEVHEALPLPG